MHHFRNLEQKVLFDIQWLHPGANNRFMSIAINNYSAFQINDTIRYWRKEINCLLPALPSKRTEAVYVALIALALFAMTILFYSGSFMQGSRRKRRLKKCKLVNLYLYLGLAQLDSENCSMSLLNLAF